MPREKLACLHCNGEGKIYFGHFTKRGWRRGRGVKCKTCKGDGGTWRDVPEPQQAASEDKQDESAKS